MNESNKQAHLEYMREWSKKYRADNPDRVMKSRIRQAANLLRKNGVESVSEVIGDAITNDGDERA